MIRCLNFASIKFRNFERKLELECTKFCDFFLIFNMKVAIATDFGTLSKESLKRMTKWGAKYFTHPSPYHPCKDVRFMTPLPPDELSKGEEQAMKDWIENYRSVRQRTVRSETTKDKAGSLPPAVYSNANPNATGRVIFSADQVEQAPTASSEIRSVVSDVSVLSFVSDATVPQLTLASTVDFNQARVVRKVDNAIQRINHYPSILPSLFSFKYNLKLYLILVFVMTAVKA